MGRVMLVEFAAFPDAVGAALDATFGPAGPDGTRHVPVPGAPLAGTAVVVHPVPPAPPGPGAAQPAGTTPVRFESTLELRVPFWGWVFGPLTRLAERRALRHAAARLEAVLAGRPPPAAPRPVPGLPSATFDGDQVALLATAAAAAAVAGFGGALFGQNSDFVARGFGTTNGALGVSLAVTRLGVLLSLVATALADRRGRRRLLLVSVTGVCLANLVSAAAPGLATFTAGQVLTRGFVNSTFAVAGIMAVEEAPEGGRAFAAAMIGLAGGFGFSFAVLTLPLGDHGAQAWRLSFVLSGAAVLLVPRIAGRLRESRRYRSLEASGIDRGRLRRLFEPDLRRRLVLLCVVGFAANVFNSPSSQLMNRFLGDERGFSGADIAVFRAVTTGVPGVVGMLLAIRVVERRGRRPVALIGLLLASSIQVVFFLAHGPLLWLSSAGSLLFAAAGGLAIGTLTAELFPTDVRATSNAVLLVVGVLGSAVGLVAAGALSDPLGGLGPAIAVLGAAPLLVAVLAVPLLPESAGRALDEVSPPAAPTPIPPML